MVRSKSEVIIANELAAKGVDYAYERPLTLEGVTKYPDFTIEDVESGQTIYWEHCGMLHVPSYRKRWQEKLDWYGKQGIHTQGDGGVAYGKLIVTQTRQTEASIPRKSRSSSLRCSVHENV
jgi:hypothetical protein